MQEIAKELKCLYHVCPNLELDTDFLVIV